MTCHVVRHRVAVLSYSQLALQRPLSAQPLHRLSQSLVDLVCSWCARLRGWTLIWHSEQHELHAWMMTVFVEIRLVVLSRFGSGLHPMTCHVVSFARSWNTSSEGSRADHHHCEMS